MNMRLSWLSEVKVSSTPQHAHMSMHVGLFTVQNETTEIYGCLDSTAL